MRGEPEQVYNISFSGSTSYRPLVLRSMVSSSIVVCNVCCNCICSSNTCGHLLRSLDDLRARYIQSKTIKFDLFMACPASAFENICFSASSVNLHLCSSGWQSRGHKLLPTPPKARSKSEWIMCCARAINLVGC